MGVQRFAKESGSGAMAPCPPLLLVSMLVSILGPGVGFSCIVVHVKFKLFGDLPFYPRTSLTKVNYAEQHSV